jgi:hypothetical protein
MEKVKAFVKKHKKALIFVAVALVLGFLIANGNNVLSGFNQ